MSSCVKEDFPLFSKWPSEKIEFMEHMSCEQYEKEYQFGYDNTNNNNDDDTINERHFVTVREEFQDEDNPLLHCPLCNERMILLYDEDEDEWVYEDTKEFLSLPYHYPLCYDYMENNHKFN